MQVKFFSGRGAASIRDMEKEINQWLTTEPADVTIKHVNTSTCTGSDGFPNDESYQWVFISIWYESTSI
jgi:hypothetical protein